MRLMTIFELAVKSEAELQVLHKQASEAAGNPGLSPTERREAAAMLANIGRTRVRQFTQ